MRVREGGGGGEGKIRLVTLAWFSFQMGMYLACLVTPLSHDFFEPTIEQSLVLYFSLHRWPSLRYYPALSTIRCSRYLVVIVW